MHVFPGLNWFKDKTEVFWHDNFTKAFLEIITPYEEDILLISGAHTHRLELRDSLYSTNLSVPLISTPSVTPKYNNNPGYATLMIDF